MKLAYFYLRQISQQLLPLFFLLQEAAAAVVEAIGIAGFDLPETISVINENVPVTRGRTVPGSKLAWVIWFFS